MRFSAALIGECMIELQEVEPGKIQQTCGGDTLNAAIYMARLGRLFPVRVDYVTALGCDCFSDRTVAFWEREGVGSGLVLRQEGEMPGLYYIQLDKDGERHFSYWRGESAAKVNFGVVMTLLIMVGNLSPPVGMCLFAVESFAKVGIWGLAAESLPYLIAILAVTVICAFVPEIALWLPNYLMGPN